MSPDVQREPGEGPEPAPEQLSSAAPQRFVWPPKQPAITPQDLHANESNPHTDPSIVVSMDAASAHQTPIKPLAIPQVTPPVRWFRAIEREWLGLSTPPWPVRAAQAGWTADTPDRFCPTCGQSVGPHELTLPKPAPGSHPEIGVPSALPVPKCSACRTQRRPWERCVRLGTYDGLLRDAVHEVKFHAWRSLGTTLGHELGQQLAPLILPGQPILLLPMPTTFRRRIVRGIDHTLVLARAVREVIGGRLVRLLVRDHRPSQLDVPASERARNVAGTFRPRARAAVMPGTLVIVIDDVMTSGSTMSAACRAVAGLPLARTSPEHPVATVGGPAGSSGRPRIWAAVLAVTPQERRRGAENPSGEPLIGPTASSGS